MIPVRIVEVRRGAEAAAWLKALAFRGDRLARQCGGASLDAIGAEMVERGRFFAVCREDRLVACGWLCTDTEDGIPRLHYHVPNESTAFELRAGGVALLALLHRDFPRIRAGSRPAYSTPANARRLALLIGAVETSEGFLECLRPTT